ncbi:MAG: glycosyltransferase family 9 protein [Bdellovibrionales bacterium]|nr:glycosyltransferase family 9 protein [Bdellovibrionales bacterium]
MKILILQLARFGDIIITLPTVHALRRKYPHAEIHVLVRSRFKQAIAHVDEVDKVWELDSRTILEPTILDHREYPESVRRTTQFVDHLIAQSFTHVFNLSFSPLSSHICAALEEFGSEIKGYTRYEDGSLAIPDDASAYFYGQVGVGKFSRIHLADIFAAICEVDLTEMDWFLNLSQDRSLGDLKNTFALSDDYLLIHVGASEKAKRLASFKWAHIVRGLSRFYEGDIVLIGSPDEASIGQEIESTAHVDRIVNLVGKTAVRDIFPLIDGSRLVLGCDSLPMQVASLLGRLCLNLSFSTVNFWETGPYSVGSRVIFADQEASLTSDRVIRETEALLSDKESGLPVVLRTGRDLVGFELRGGLQIDDYEFNLIEALYMDGNFPQPRTVEEELMYQRLDEVCSLALEQLDLVIDPQTRKMAMEILEQVDRILETVDRMVPSMFPLLSWFQTERLRVGPGSLEVVVAKTIELFSKLQLICRIFVDSSDEDMMNQDYETYGEDYANQEMVE